LTICPDVWSISDDTDQPNATRVPAGLSCISAGVSGLRGAPFRTSVSIRLWGRSVFAGYYTSGATIHRSGWWRSGRSMDKRAEAFLTYLDKEGTVMGLLSGFCLAALGLVWKAIGDASADSLFDDLQGEWVSFGLLIAGSMSLLGAALLFYLQRSLLLRIYGDICLDGREGEATRRRLNAWRDEIRYGWRRYHAGFVLLVFGFCCLIGALVPLLMLRVRGGEHQPMIQGRSTSLRAPADRALQPTAPW